MAPKFLRFARPSSRAVASLDALGERARALPGNRDGMVAIIFGLALLPLATLVGAALDYGRATSSKEALSAAADLAVLSAVNRQSMSMTAAQARQAALDMFAMQAGGSRFTNGVTPVVSVQDTATIRTATVSYTATVPTTLLSLIGISTIAISGQSAGTSAPPVYMDFYLVLDNTPSMGVAATTADIAKMVANTGSDKCAFACHNVSANGNDYYALAKRLGVTMRIDVVRQATQQLMDTATSTATVSGQYRAAISTFGSSCSTPGLNSIASLTSNLSSVKSSAAAIDLMTIPYDNYNSDQCTNFDAVFASAKTAIPSGGDGSSSSPQPVLFFVSDGVADAYYPSSCTRPTTGGRCQEPIKTSNCQAIKDRGIKIAVLYTTYLPLPTNSWYNDWIAPFASTIPAKMESCASPGLFFEVSPSQGIADAMTALFKRTVAQAKLTR